MDPVTVTTLVSLGVSTAFDISKGVKDVDWSALKNVRERSKLKSEIAKTYKNERAAYVIEFLTLYLLDIHEFFSYLDEALIDTSSSKSKTKVKTKSDSETEISESEMKMPSIDINISSSLKNSYKLLLQNIDKSIKIATKTKPNLRALQPYARDIRNLVLKCVSSDTKHSKEEKLQLQLAAKNLQTIVNTTSLTVLRGLMNQVTESGIYVQLENVEQLEVDSDGYYQLGANYQNERLPGRDFTGTVQSLRDSGVVDVMKNVGSNIQSQYYQNYQNTNTQYDNSNDNTIIPNIDAATFE